MAGEAIGLAFEGVFRAAKHAAFGIDFDLPGSSMRLAGDFDLDANLRQFDADINLRGADVDPYTAMFGSMDADGRVRTVRRSDAEAGISLLKRRAWYADSGGILPPDFETGGRRNVFMSAGDRLSMQKAVDKAVAHVGPDGFLEITGRSYQFRYTATDSYGRTITRIGRFDIDPTVPHVRAHGPHLNIETRVKLGKRDLYYENVHWHIDPSTIRASEGSWDYP